VEVDIHHSYYISDIWMLHLYAFSSVVYVDYISFLFLFLLIVIIVIFRAA